MGDFDAALQALSSLLRPVGVDWPGSKWEWDHRLDCALSAIATADEARARATLGVALAATWTADSLAGAPPIIRQICARSGGLLPRQLAFSAQLPDGVFACGLWWPWGNGAQVSVRIGASHQSVLPGVRAALGL
jgi:hypothetical protein